ncbi:hypothetical protein CRYUN_Cryun01aG0069700 [Craigia yunnanensis]
MFYSFCKRQIYIRGGTRISPASQCLSFLQNHAIIPLALRYVSRIASNEHSFTVSYLINSCGFSPESALSVSKTIHFENPEKPDSVISFFKSHGFSQTQVRNIIKKRPKLLLSVPEKTLLPKFRFFYSKRISRSELVRILSSNPHVFEYDLDNRIIPSFNFFKELTHCDDNKVFLAYKNFSSVLTRNLQSVFAPNLAILLENGVPESIIMNKLVVHPRIFAENHDKFRRTAEEVKKLGFNPLKQRSLIALQALIQISKSTWERKYNVFKQWGWTDEEIVSAFEKYPRCMIFSEHKITATMNFYVNTMGWKSSYIANCPALLSYSLERRIIPRCSVLQALLSKGLIEKFSVYAMLMYTEKDFLQRDLYPKAQKDHPIQSKPTTTQTFENFQSLLGCRKGHTVEGLYELKQFLKKLSYLNYDHASNNGQKYGNDNEFDDHLQSAIKAYQVNYQLNTTGSLDADTYETNDEAKMWHSDVIINSNNSKSIYRIGASHYEFFLGNLKWPLSKTHLTYNFRSSVEVPLEENIRSVCMRAFQRWANVSRFTFEEVAEYYVADIEIGFHSGEHGDGNPFDGPQGTLAHASPTGGKLHYNADENWSINPGPDEIDLESVTVHEIGRLLGLQHSLVPNAVMYAYFDSGITKRKLQRDDVHSIRALYGLL